jgi:histidinol dehydrogenase
MESFNSDGMKWYDNPLRKDWPEFLLRPVQESVEIEPAVSKILAEVRHDGDKALRKFSEIFDKSVPEKFEVGEDELAASERLLNEELKASIKLAAANIERFHRAQVKEGEAVEIMTGIRCWRRIVPIQKIGFYIPGGTAPLFSTILMLGIPASLAGCEDIVLCSPPGSNGKLNPAILFAARLAGIKRVFAVGGAQAIAAMAYGTETIPRVYKIFGPGNQYVTCAKMLAQKEGVAIDMPAGPSELAIFADETANPEWVAADLLSQAEHGEDSQVILVCLNRGIAKSVEQALGRQLEKLARKQIAAKSITKSKIFLLETENEALDLINQYAPEHLILATKNPHQQAQKVTNAGSVFLGHFTPESAGDYASGTNHVLPTNGYAHSYSGVSVDSFVRKITFQEISADGLMSIGSAVEVMAGAEGLDAHANAVNIRKNKKQD